MSNEELVTMYQHSADEKRREILATLYTQNIGFLNLLAWRYKWAADMDDLLQECFFGLMEAANRWKPDGGACFINYAKPWILQGLRNYIDNSCRPVRLPRDFSWKLTQYETLLKDTLKATGQEPSDDVIMAELDITSDQLDMIKQARQMQQFSSLEAPITEDLTLADMISDPKDVMLSAEEKLQQEELSAALWAAVREIGGREEQILRKRYQEGKTLKDAGEDLGISMERARQIEAKAMRKIRSGKHREKLESFIEKHAHEYAYHHSGLKEFNNSWSSSIELLILRMEEKWTKENSDRSSI